MRFSFWLTDAVVGVGFGCDNFGIFLVERRFSIAMIFFCFEDFVIRAWRAEAYVVAGFVMGRTCGDFLGRSFGGITLGRGTGCAIFFCGWASFGATLGGRAGCICFFCGVMGGAVTLGSCAGLLTGVSAVPLGGVWSVVVLPKILLSF